MKAEFFKYNAIDSWLTYIILNEDSNMMMEKKC